MAATALFDPCGIATGEPGPANAYAAEKAAKLAIRTVVRILTKPANIEGVLLEI
jgi:hypothetical protein